ncbi:MAG: efflux RND transporter permease subunit, partial [Spirochaetaceae bacterium]|nr:efflux RND transporter permease subunit [Spirochaetaceae bacterium]
FTVSGHTDLVELTDFIDNRIIPDIAGIEGVSDIELIGGMNKKLEINLSLEKLNARDLTVLDIYNVLKASNQSIPAGSTTYRERELSIKTEGQFDSIDEIGSMVVGSRDQSLIQLKDIAEISLIDNKPDFYVSSNGKQMILINVKRREAADSMKIIHSINMIIERTEKDSPYKIDISKIKDDSIITGNSLRSVVQAGIIGILMAIMILYLFLKNISATAIIAASLPLCIFIALIGMYLMGQTINILSLSGLTVALGMIVDSSIVVLEHVTRKFKTIGNRKTASSQAASEIGGAVLASTLTTICVFIPLLFLKGIIGIFLRNISLTMISSISASFLVAIIVVPFLTSRHFNPDKKGKKRKEQRENRISRKLTFLMTFLNRSFLRVLTWSLNHRKTVLLLLTTILLTAVLPLTSLGIAFVPSVDTGEIEVFVETPQGYSLEQTKDKVQVIEKLLQTTSDFILSQAFIIGMENSESQVSVNNRAFGRINLRGSKNRDISVLEIIKLFQYTIDSQVPDVKTVFVNGGYDSMLALGVGGRGFLIDIYSNDNSVLKKAAYTVESILGADPDVVKTAISVNFENREVVNRLLLDQMGNLGITPLEAALSNRILFNGIKTGIFRNNDKNYDIYLTSELKQRSLSNDLLNQILLKSPSGRTVDFSGFSQYEINPSPSSINKKNRQQTIRITGYMNKNETGGITSRIRNSLNNMDFPADLSWKIEGSSALLFDSIGSLLLVLSISVFLVYAVMVIQFEKFLQPLAIMASIPFCLIGIVFGLKLFGSSITIIAFLGLVALAGIVVNNAIVMIDYINLLRKRDGLDLQKAITKGTQSRIRPILMTTLTTMLGILPLALGKGDGAEFYAPLGQTIFGGLFSSTIITLILIPVLYYMVESRDQT